MLTATVSTTDANKAGLVSIQGIQSIVDRLRSDMRGLQGQELGSVAIAADVLCALQRLGIGTVEVVEGIELTKLAPLPPGFLS